MIGKIVNYKGKKIKIIEKADGYADNSKNLYWVKAIEAVNGYKKGEEFNISEARLKRLVRNS